MDAYNESLRTLAAETLRQTADERMKQNGTQRFSLEDYRYNAGFINGLLVAIEVLDETAKTMRKGE